MIRIKVSVEDINKCFEKSTVFVDELGKISTHFQSLGKDAIAELLSSKILGGDCVK